MWKSVEDKNATFESVTQKLCINPREVTEEELVTAFNPDLHKRTGGRSAATTISLIVTPEGLDRVHQLWLSAAKAQQFHPDQITPVLRAIAEHPLLTPEAALSLTEMPYNEVRKALRENLNVPARIRVLATV